MSATAASCAASHCGAGAARLGEWRLSCFLYSPGPWESCTANNPHRVTHMLTRQSILSFLSRIRRRLRELRAANCGSLSLGDSELHCPALEEVNLFGNRQLDADGRLACRIAATSHCCADRSRVVLIAVDLHPDSAAAVVHKALALDVMLQGWRPQLQHCPRLPPWTSQVALACHACCCQRRQSCRQSGMPRCLLGMPMIPKAPAALKHND